MRYNLRVLLPAISVSLILMFSAVLAHAEEGAAVTEKIAADSIKSATSSRGKVASVNGVAVSQERFNTAMAPYQQQIDALGEGTVTAEKLAEIKTTVLENLICNELLYQESHKIGIKVEEKEINEAYDSRKAQFASEAEFLETLNQYKFTTDEFKDQIKWGLSIQHFINKQFTISDEEAKQFYNDNPDEFLEPAQAKVSHIMIMVDSSADQAKKEAAKKQLEEALKRLKAGEDFAALAKEVSEDIDTKENGGDLDYFYKGQMVQYMGDKVQAFEDASFALKPGEISNIVETGYGYHIIKLIDKKDPTKIGYDSSKEDIMSYLQNSKVNKYVTELRAKAKVEIFLAD
ncbi:MAG: peptidylprolyl isomerase [Deltaproteobacteria bacterium]|nr:peptidylprolyl isomerase [Deltaproteobacteria bacterium]